MGLIAKTGRMDGWFEAEDRVSGWLDWRVREGVLELLRDGLDDEVRPLHGLLQT